MTEFYVIMLKRQDGKVHADLHKTNQVIYLTIEDAYEEWNNTEHYKEYYHIVKLIASCEDEIKELESKGHLTNWHRHPPQGQQMPYNTLISNQTDGLRN